MSAREELAEVIRDGVDTWRTPLEAADAILAAGYRRELPRILDALDAVTNLHECDPDFGKCTDCDDEWPCRTVAAITTALEADQ